MKVFVFLLHKQAKNILNRSVQVPNNKMTVRLMKYIVVKCFPNYVELGWVGTGIGSMLGLGETNIVRIFCVASSFFLLWLQEPIAVTLKAPADGKELILWHFCKGWWEALVQSGTAFSCYLPANLWRLFLTGHVSHQNITDGSSSFVFMPQQAAHKHLQGLQHADVTAACVTVTSEDFISRTLKRCGPVWDSSWKSIMFHLSQDFLHQALFFLSMCPWCLSHVVTKRS